ncbi:MAG: helix-turn-helix domain-containing protein [Bacteroidota bacterium]
MVEFQLNIFSIIYLFGTLQGLILAGIFLFSQTFSKKSNGYMASMLIVFMALNLLGVFEEARLFSKYPALEFLPIVWYGIIPPATYFFVQYLTAPAYKFPRWGYYLFIPFIVQFIFQSSEFILFLLGKINLTEYLPVHYVIENTFETVSAFYALIVSVVILKTLFRYEKSLYNDFAEINDKSLRWLSHTLLGGLVLIFVWFIVAFSDYFQNSYVQMMSRFLMIGLSVLIYWIGYSMLMRRELFVRENIMDEIIPVSPTEETTKLSDRADDHYRKLIAVMEENHLYRNPDINMSILSEKIGLSKGYLSQIINNKEHKNFFDFINTYRVEEVKQKMANAEFAHFNILGLAMDAGFKSKSTFNAVFKKMTGQTPSQYRRDLKQ